MSTTVPPPKPKRRWYQFSLLTLLVVLTLSCLGFAWVGWRMHRAQENRETPVNEAVAWIEESGGHVVSDYRDRRSQTYLEMLFDDPGGQDDPVVLKVTKGYLGDNVTDSGLKHLKALTSLQYLTLTGTKVTDEGVDKLQQALPNCKISH